MKYPELSNPPTEVWQNDLATYRKWHTITPRAAASTSALIGVERMPDGGRARLRLVSVCVMGGVGCRIIAEGGNVTNDGKPWCGCVGVA